MEFGDKEWFEALEERTKFPSVFAFYVSNKGGIYSGVVDTKAFCVGNVKYASFAPNNFYLYEGDDCALTEIIRLHSPQEYYDKVKELRDVWGTFKKAASKEEEEKCL